MTKTKTTPALTRRISLPRLAITLALFPAGCAVTSHDSAPARQGQSIPLAQVEATLGTPGPVQVETLRAADWQVARAGLINLDHPRAQALTDGPEPVGIYLHALRHPSRGLFIVDTGVAHNIKAQDGSPIGGLVARGADLDAMHVHVDTRRWLAGQERRLSGVFLTHLHLDHILGLPDVPASVPVFAGPGEAQVRGFGNMFVQGTTNRLLAGRGPLQTWNFQGPDEQLRVLDVFADQSVFALHVPGHTPGSTAYLVRSPEGPVLIVGDACHTSWGWEHAVEPGTFSHDQPRSVRSLQQLKALVARRPNLHVRLGHQEHAENVAARPW